MPSRPKRSKDANVRAFQIVLEATGQSPRHEIVDRNPAYTVRASKGGAGRAKRLTAEQRHEIARKAASSRWSKKR